MARLSVRNRLILFRCYILCSGRTQRNFAGFTVVKHTAAPWDLRGHVDPAALDTARAPHAGILSSLTRLDEQHRRRDGVFGVLVNPINYAGEELCVLLRSSQCSVVVGREQLVVSLERFESERIMIQRRRVSHGGRFFGVSKRRVNAAAHAVLVVLAGLLVALVTAALAVG